jgi:hypothetical protein
MYIIDKEKNRISKLQEKTFSELKFKERQHLQEWIANNPSSLGEELLIIQKEFSGFAETNERLDLLAIDKSGNLVIIENKLDDSGKDVTWQSIKYASYCSSLTKQEIIKIYQEYLGSNIDAKEKISEFIGDNKEIDEITLNQGLNTQRLIMIAAKFQKEVTSSVLWLMNFKMRIQCFIVTPYALNEQLFLNVEQILPIRDTEDFTIRIASKAQEEIEVQETMKNRHLIRLKFWELFINKSKKQNHFISNMSPSKDSWLSKGIGIGGAYIDVCITKNSCRSEFIINIGEQELNKKAFDILYKDYREIVEQNIGVSLNWERMDDKKSSRIRFELLEVSYFNEEDWEKMIDFLLDSSTKLEKEFKKPITKIINDLKK